MTVGQPGLSELPPAVATEVARLLAAMPAQPPARLPPPELARASRIREAC
jgi:hypothetical protein